MKITLSHSFAAWLVRYRSWHSNIKSIYILVTLPYPLCNTFLALRTALCWCLDIAVTTGIVHDTVEEEMAVVYFSVRTGTLITLTVFMISIVHFHAVSLIIRLSFDITSRRRFYWEWMRWGKTLTTVRVRQIFKCQTQLTRNARYSIVFEVLFKDGR